jgi:[histone H3]-trimethyl-L-lysine4 demethylase
MMPTFAQAREGAEPLHLKDTPVYRPTSEQFADPLRFIASIREEAEPYGLCRIIPPDDWQPTCAIDRKAFKFPTRIQSVHELQERTSSFQAQHGFHRDYQAFLKAHDRTLKKNPVFGSREIDLYKFFKAVTRRGGYQSVTDSKTWKDISRILQVHHPCSTSFPGRR